MIQVPERLIYRYLDTNGDGTGTKNAVGNYTTETEFFIAPGLAYQYGLHRMIVSIQDASGSSAAEYGNIGSALTNGIKISVIDSSDNELLDLTDGLPIKTNAEWAAACYDDTLNTWGQGNELFAIRWTFTKDSGDPLLIKPGNRFSVVLNDDLTGLVSHKFFVRGKII
ncbi:MAG: hypothetical protein KZQ94_15950 [Candidatus Thiodiazotropha sp. (ex Troendleina suluensis)]|nr:hypothetical protein [Candidatus Thiodiazotropha sp. (ex Troendleina suluensis)]